MSASKQTLLNPLRLFKVVVFALALLPAVLFAFAAFNLGPLNLGADPVRRLLHACGITALNLLMLTLTVSPLHSLWSWIGVLAIRRMLGLFAFFYALLHFLVYLVLDQGLNLQAIMADILKRPYITIGVLALLLMKPLAVTSTRAMMRRLGRRWTMLHRLIYLIGFLGLWHFWWQVKRDFREPLAYAAVFALLMLWRVIARSAPAKAPGKT